MRSLVGDNRAAVADAQDRRGAPAVGRRRGRGWCSLAAEGTGERRRAGAISGGANMRRLGASGGLDWAGYPFAVFVRAVDPAPLIVDRGSVVAVAIERFRRDRGTMPAGLGDLVPVYLTAVPADPYPGHDLLFRAGPGRYTIYSVGPDGKDNGGDLTSQLEGVIRQGYGRHVIAGTDIGVRVVDLR